MKTRREFFKACATAGILSTVDVRAASPHASTASIISATRDDRCYWLSVLERIADPVLMHLSRRELKKTMPVETAGDAEKLKNYTHLEAFARLLTGIAPWLELRGLSGAEAKLRQKYSEMVCLCLDAATDRKSPDFLNFSSGQQPLVDAAFLAQAIIRAPGALWHPLDQRVRQQIIDALKATRVITPINNNHVLFAASVETALLKMGESTLEARLENYLRQMLSWYRGDGVYGDGEFFRFDYYNSFVIHPMLVDNVGLLSRKDTRFTPAYKIILERSRRYAEIQERLIAPDGTFPSIGRSTAYRFGAFQTLAQMALLHELPDAVKPVQVRCALTAVMKRMIEAPGTFDKNGWLRVGFCGHQLSLGDRYISTGSLYLCSAGLLALGLPPSDAFWTAPAAPWTSQRIWSGESLPPDHALHDDVRPLEIPTLSRKV